MNTTSNSNSGNVMLMVAIVAAVLGLGGLLLMNATNASKTDSSMMADESSHLEETVDAIAVDVMEKPNKEEALMEADTSVVGDTTEAMEATGAMMADAGEYLDYSDAAFAAAADKKRVLFFHATWCPDCKAANTEIISMAEKIPADVAIFKADYDTQKELKKKYGIANQHSFVLVNTAGEAITKWNGGTFATLLGKVQ